MIDRIIQKNEKKLIWLKRIPWITCGFLQIFVTLMFWDSFTSSQENLKFYLLISILIFVGSSLGYLVTKSDTKRLQKAIAISMARRPALELTSDFLFIPTLMLMNPAFWRALDRDLSEIQIPLNDIVDAQLFYSRGSKTSVLMLKLRGESEFFTQGQIGDLKLFNFGLKIQMDLTDFQQKTIVENLTQKSF